MGGIIETLMKLILSTSTNIKNINMGGIIETLMKLLEIRNMIIFNLVLQSILTLFSPLRKTSANTAITNFLWLAYTVAGLAAEYAVGLVTRATMTNTSTTNQPLVALWAPYILFQVVGPDSVTAFSMEDNKSWFRSSCRTFLTCVVLNRAIMVLLPQSRVAVAVFLVFSAAVLKYGERSQSLFFGNLTRFKTFTKPLVLEGRRRTRLPTFDLTLPHDDNGSGDGWKLSNAEVVMGAYEFFQTFKGVFANVVFTDEQCSGSREYFFRIDSGGALAVVETELNFTYDVLFTKALVLRQGMGRAFRLSCIVFELVAFFVWISVDTSEFDEIDVRVTYTLVTSMIIFEVFNLLMMVLSDWTIARVLLDRTAEEDRTLLIKSIHKFLSLKNFLRRRWSGSVSRCSLIMMSTSRSGPIVEKVLDWLKIKGFVYGWRNWWNMSRTIFDDKLRDIILDELKYRSGKAEDLQVAKQMSSARGDWILRDYYHSNQMVLSFADTSFTNSMEFSKIVLLWHVVTELCYYAYSSDTDNHGKRECELSKVISDYMAYLLIGEDTMLSEVAGEAKAMFEHTCDEVVKMLIAREADMRGSKDKNEKARRACRVIVMADSDQVREATDQAEDEASVLEGARSLSKELNRMAEQGIEMWEVMSKVWVELLCYTAFKCKASDHAAQLCKGGQLLTIVWLLMAHLGLSNRFEDPI